MCGETFARHDKDKSGSIDEGELVEAMHEIMQGRVRSLDLTERTRGETRRRKKSGRGRERERERNSLGVREKREERREREGQREKEEEGRWC